jgi:Mg2+ and Co2+ transporter CorA
VSFAFEVSITALTGRYSESVSRVEVEARKSHATLLASILAQRKELEKVGNKVLDAQEMINNHARRQLEKTDLVDKQLGDATATLRHVRDTTDTTNTALVNIRSLVTQLVQRYTVITNVR